MGRRNRKRKGAGDNPAPEPNPLQRANVPDEWERGGEVDEVEAALVSGAGGEPTDVSDEELARQAQEALGRPDAEREVEADVAAAASASRDRAAVRATGKGAAPGQATGGGFRLFAFFRASWAELQRVQWPDRRQVAQATAVVLGFVVIAGAYLGLADAAAQKVIDWIL